MTHRLPFLLAAAAFALAACSGAGTTATDTGAAPAPSDGPQRVAIDDFAFSPETLSVPAGTTVTWSNEDATSHTVTAGSEDEPDPQAFDLEVDEQGQTVAFTFEDAGTYAYYCELHPFMTGTIEVTS